VSKVSQQLPDDEIKAIVQRVLQKFMSAPAAGGASTSPTSTQTAATSPVEPPQDRPGALTVAIGADHGGYELKELLKAHLAGLGCAVTDVGTGSKQPVDYPDYAHEVALLVSTGKCQRGIMIDGAGIGSCIVANKVPGVRAGMAYDYSSALNGREHNDTNVLTLGAGLIGANLARQIVSAWIATPFGGGRHQARIDKINAVEKHYLK
jgi:ribose 5-phosphate isomerase B